VSSASGASFALSPVCLERGELELRGPRSSVRLRRFQEDIVRFFVGDRRYLFLQAPTGSGKTLTVLAPLVAQMMGGPRRDGVLAVYPTRALVMDQVASIASTLERLGAREILRHSDALRVYDVSLSACSGGGCAGGSFRIALLALTSTTVSEIADELLSADAPRRFVLKKVVEDIWLRGARADYIVTFAVPEYPYLLASRLYSNPGAENVLARVALGEVQRYAEALVKAKSAEEVEAIRQEARELVRGLGQVGRDLINILTGLGDSVFMDEYHVWGGFEKPSVLALVASYILIGSFTGVKFKLVFSSATPDPDTIKLVEEATGETVERVEAHPTQCGENTDVIRGPTVVELLPVKTRPGPVGWLQIDSQLPNIVESKLDELRATERFFVLGRRVSSVEAAARAFHERTGRKPVVITGVEHPEFPGREELVKRKESGDLPLFGNFSVEVGVDIKNVNYGVVVAVTRGELVQRAGRIGRGPSKSKLVIPVPDRYYGELARELADVLDYEEALTRIGGYMYARIPVAKALERLASDHLGKARIYLPLSAALVWILASDKARVADSHVVESARLYLRVLEHAGFSERDGRWLRDRVAKTREVLAGLAAYRVAWSVPYVRRQNGSEVRGEASWSTLLSNFDVKLEGGSVRLVKSSRKAHQEIFALYAIGAEKLRSLLDSVVPAWQVVEAARINPRLQKLPEQETLALLLAQSSEPVYVAPPEVVYDLLPAFGYAVRVVHRNSGTVLAYLVPL
jgi:hypothetical protein